MGFKVAYNLRKDYRNLMIIFFVVTKTITAELPSSLAVKALRYTSKLPKEIEKCFIGEYMMKRETIFGCAALCDSNPACLLACKSGPRCRLYNANVSPKWDNSSYSDFNTILYDFSCTSFWAEAKDVAGNVNITGTPTLYPSNSLPENAMNGFGCQAHDVNFIYVSQSVANPWLLADLGTRMFISRVVIQSRGPKDYGESCFENAEVRIGNETNSGDFSTYAILGTYSGHAVNGEIIIFKGEKPLQGRYVSVQLLKSTYLVITEMKIIKF